MSKLDELLQGVDVEWKALGEVCEIIRGVRVTKKDLIENGKYPVVSGGTGYMGFVNEYNREENSITIAQYGTAGFVKWQNEKFWANDVAFTIYPINEDILLKRFLYYFLINKQNYLYDISNKIAVPFSISKEKILQIKIPIAPIEIQQEIVRVLDELTSLTNQLKTELETERQNRKKQIEFFREQLLSFKKGNVEWKTLGDIGNVKMCKRIFKNETKDFGDIPFYKIGTFGKTANAYISRELYEDYKEKYSYPNKGDILISAAGTIGRTVVFDGKPAYFQDSNIIWIENNQETIINEYLCHFYKVAKWYVSGGGTIDRLYNDNVRKTKIPVPFPNDKEKSLAEQKRIVKLLDQFDATHTAIEEEITKEIKLRTQQYEYYREKLLSFPQN